jgi:hypothetical protein
MSGLPAYPEQQMVKVPDKSTEKTIIAAESIKSRFISVPPDSVLCELYEREKKNTIDISHAVPYLLSHGQNYLTRNGKEDLMHFLSNLRKGSPRGQEGARNGR